MLHTRGLTPPEEDLDRLLHVVDQHPLEALLVLLVFAFLVVKHLKDYDLVNLEVLTGLKEVLEW